MVVEHRELQATLSRHPDVREDASGQTLVVAHSLATAAPVFNLASDDDEDVKLVRKKDHGGDGSSSGCYGGGGRYGGGGGIGY
jgi:uncharacterized membrane protein YgcG